jgi:hypothetical protein
MTKKEFLKDYYFTFQIVKSDNATLMVITGVIERISHKVVDTIKTTIDIPATNDWIKEGESDKSMTEWNLNQSTDKVKRFQLDYFVKRIGIEKFVPLDVVKNEDIGELYK